MPRFELKITWSRGQSVLAVLTLLSGIAAACVCCRHLPQAPQTAAQTPTAAAQAPEFIPGLPADFKEKAREAFKEYPQPFRVGGSRDDLRQKSVYLWEAVLRVATPRKPLGQHYTCGPQLTGDCVAWNGCTAIFYTGANAVIAGNASAIDDPCQPISYGITRVTEGGGRPRCGQAGAYPSDFANGFVKRGWVTWSESGLTYSGSLSDQLGCRGPTAEQLRLAATRAGGACYPIRTVDELLEALHNGYAGSAGFDWQPGQTRSDRGRMITLFNGRYRGGHQVAWVGWDAERQHCIFHNSHGPDAHPRNDGDPPGSFRVNLSTLEWMLKNGEFWAFSSVPGFPPQELDLSPLRPRKRPAAQPQEVSDARDCLWHVCWNCPDALPRLFDRDGRRVPDARYLCQHAGRRSGPVSDALPCVRRGPDCRRRPVADVCLAAVLDRSDRRRPAGHAAAATSAGSAA